uniref:laccase n=1 Tax=Ganoderma boninense TaxID=34458 RepID=A0A5K1JSJ0_9APHY|nr:Laccase (Putative laccase) [Ganoderma boninense]
MGSGGAAGAPHPFHSHGVSVSSFATLTPPLTTRKRQHTFYVVRSAGQTDYNFANPPQRDVVNVGEVGDNVTIRFTTNNPGPWFLHCHIDYHLEAGFAIVLAEEDDEVSSSVTPTSELSVGGVLHGEDRD